MSILTAEQFARLLDGRECGEEISKEEEAIAAESRLFVFFGDSDDGLKVLGILCDFFSAIGGRKVTIAKVINSPYWAYVTEQTKALVSIFVQIRDSFVVNAIWNPDDPDTTWLIATDVPSFPFDIMEDGNLFCRGIVIAESDVLEHSNSKGSAQ